MIKSKMRFHFNTLLNFHVAPFIQKADPKDDYKGAIRNGITTNIRIFIP